MIVHEEGEAASAPEGARGLISGAAPKSARSSAEAASCDGRAGLRGALIGGREEPSSNGSHATAARQGRARVICGRVLDSSASFASGIEAWLLC